MKNIHFWVLFLIFLAISFCCLYKNDEYEVLSVKSATKFYVDFNRNKVADENELVQLLNIDTELPEISKIDNLRLSYVAKTFAQSVLLDKKIKITKTTNKGYQITLSDGQDYETLLVQKGLVLGTGNKSLLFDNIKNAKNLNLVAYNTFSKKYHTLDCEHSKNSPHLEIVAVEDLPNNASPCRHCQNVLDKKASSSNKITSQNQNKKFPIYTKEEYAPAYKDNNLELYITDFTKYYYPSDKCFTTPCVSLLNQINSAQNTIDFAIYGIDKQPEIVQALLNAQNRGVKIRWIFDVNKNGSTIYKENIKLKEHLKHYKSDIDIDKSRLDGKTYKDAIMHNKFFIFDEKIVWTGSANISHTDLSGFNANSSILIHSAEIAKIYKKEFEQMYSGLFHKLKLPTKENLTILDNSSISVYFSPQDKIITTKITELINSSKKYIYVPVFVITHKDFNNALIQAKQRGVDVKIIIDATSANSKYSSVGFLRENGIKIKVENRAGKMHMKSIIIDDEIVVLGSMNFTKSGESYNDENVLLIKNSTLAKSFKDKFLYFYNSIDDKWLYKNPSAEGINSINSCFDGVDNDFDGDVDSVDNGCSFVK